MTVHTQDFTLNVPGRLVYCGSLMKPSSFKNGAPRYNTQFLLPKNHPDIQTLQAAIMVVVKAAFPGRDPKSLGLPLKDGDRLFAEAVEKGKDKPFYQGQMVFSAQKPEKDTKGNLLAPPRLVVLQAGKYVPYTDDERPLAGKFFYSGVKACGTFQLASYEGFGGGVTAYLNRVLSLGAGEKIVTGIDDEAVFGSVEKFAGHIGAMSTEDPTVGMGASNPW